MSGDEFQVHNHVSELMKALGLKGGAAAEGVCYVGADVFTDTLLNNMTPYVSTGMSQTVSHEAKRKIAESSTKPVEFLAKYDDLKAKNVRNIDQLVYFLSKLTADQQTKQFLKKHATEHRRMAQPGLTLDEHQEIVQQLPAPGSQVTIEQVTDLKQQLKSGSQKSVLAGPYTTHYKSPSEKVVIPEQPNWISKRSVFPMNFLLTSNVQPQWDKLHVTLLSAANLERALLKDILYCMQGINGRYIVSKPNTNPHTNCEFDIHPALDMPTKNRISRMLPLFFHYSTIVRYIEEKSRLEFGLVNQALSAAMDGVMDEYFLLITQLEHQMNEDKLTLQTLWSAIQPTMNTFELLSSIATAINKGSCYGGSVLTLLHEKTLSLVGNPPCYDLCLHLTKMACVPYFQILEKWVYKGLILDPYLEFLIKENTTIQKEALEYEFTDTYWEGKYVIKRECIPVFLEHSADKILNTGKYLNVVRLCVNSVQCPNASTMSYAVDGKMYYEQIHEAYSYASKLLLHMLVEEQQIIARISSLKNYFLLAKGDFVTLFMDMTEDEMKKDIDDIMTSRLETLLEVALHSSTALIDPYMDDLKVDLLPYDLITHLFKIMTINKDTSQGHQPDPIDMQLSGLESFSFDYDVKWPVSLVISRQILTRYQILFRHLFYCKHVERQLCNVWMLNHHRKGINQSKMLYTTANTLRHEMLIFIRNFDYYIHYEVVEVHWQAFMSCVQTARNIDELLTSHSEFLENCLEDCMLTNTILLKLIHKIMMVCITFCNFMQRVNSSTFFDYSDDPLRQSTLQAVPSLKKRSETMQFKKKAVSHAEQAGSSENFERTVLTFQKNYEKLLASLLTQIRECITTSNSQDKLFHLVYRVDYNGFYEKHLGASTTNFNPPE